MTWHHQQHQSLRLLSTLIWRFGMLHTLHTVETSVTIVPNNCVCAFEQKVSGLQRSVKSSVTSLHGCSLHAQELVKGDTHT
jgi:hypothetical protein